MYTLTLKTPPTVEPITNAEATAYMRLGTLVTAETNYLTGLIKAAREYCERYQNRAYITQTWEISLDEFPVDDSYIEIPKGKLQSITSVIYTDSAGTATTLTVNTDYIVSIRGIRGRISPPYGDTWPTASLWPLDPIVITFVCGYGDTAATVPQTAIQAMYMLISYWWDNRTAAAETVPKEVEFAVKALLTPDRIVVV